MTKDANIEPFGSVGGVGPAVRDESPHLRANLAAFLQRRLNLVESTFEEGEEMFWDLFLMNRFRTDLAPEYSLH